MKVISKNSKFDLTEIRETALNEGIALLIDKDSDWTSFNVVSKVRNLIGIKKVGHAGTLDPLATGLLILCLGKGTKQIENFMGLNKVYNAQIKLGATTKSDDSEFPECNVKDTSHLSIDMVNLALDCFIGTIEQMPPIFSAKKVKGKRAYKLARENKPVELKKSIVTIDKINTESINLPELSVEIVCSKGTYIRSIARDLGEKLNVGGYLKGLRRTKIGEYSVNDAFTIKELIKLTDN